MSWPPFSISPSAHARTVVSFGALRSWDVGARVVQERLAMTAAIWHSPTAGTTHHGGSRRCADTIRRDVVS
jgi:hypothetical protein